LEIKDNPSIMDINTKINELLDSRDNLISQVKSIHQKKIGIRTEIVNITSKLAVDKAELEPLYKQINSLRNQRFTLITNIRKIRTRIRSLNNAYQEFDRSSKQIHSSERNFRLKENYNVLSKKLTAIEWKLQTQRLTREEEKQLIEYIKVLEIKLIHWKKVDSNKKELHGLFTEIKQMSSKLDALDSSHNSIKVSFANKKDTFDEQLKTREQLFLDLENYSETVLDLDKALDKSDYEINLLKNERKRILKSMKEFTKSGIIAKKKVTLEKEKVKAKKKLELGESLSFNELKLAFDEDDEYLK
tara:strand:- start:2461 stop:3366 length:906 start_codon:yes stop_codon:yes gene_type:complete